MRKFIYLISLVLLPLNVFAEGNIINVECPSNINKGEAFTCEVTGHSDYGICAIEYEYILPENVTKVSFKVDDIWQGDEENNLVLLYTDQDKSGYFSIGTIELVAKEDLKDVNFETKWLLYGDSKSGDHIIIDKDKGVNELKENSKIEQNQENNNKNYAIIISIIVILLIIVFIFIFIKKRKNKKVGVIK